MMPTLRELDAKLIRCEMRGEERTQYTVPVATLAEAQGVRFLCPKCYVENGGRVGTHVVMCWCASRGAPDDASPAGGRWTLDGTCLDDLTLNGDPPGTARSVLLIGGCAWHGFVNDGVAE